MNDNPNFDSWESSTCKLDTPCGTLYLTQGFGEKGHEKCFIHGLGKTGGCIPAMLVAIQRLIARSFKNGATYLEIVEDLEGIHCNNPIYERGNKYESCLELIASYYKEYKETPKEDKGQGN